MLNAFLTPVLYLVVAVIALRLAGGAFGAIARRTALALLLLPLLFTGRALLTGRVCAPIDIPFAARPLSAVAERHDVDEIRNPALIDIAGQLIPWQAAARHAWSDGEWPLRNPFSLTSDSLAGGALAAPYDPLHLVGLLLPLSNAITFQATATLFLAGLGMFLFVRDLGCRDPAALVGAVGWAFSGFVVFWMENPIGGVVSLLPWLMLAVRRVAARPTLGAGAVLLAVFVLVILGGHPESTLHLVAIAAVYGLWELGAMGAGHRARAAAVAGLAGIAAVMACAVFLLPIVDTVGQTWEHVFRRQVFAHSDRSAELAQLPLEVAQSVIPFTLGVPGSEMAPHELYPPNMAPWMSGYAGSVLFAPALLGLWRSRWRGRFVIAAVGLVGLLAGASAPGVSDLLGRLPLFDISLNHRLVFAPAFAVAVLAALGMEAWAAAPASRAPAWLHLAVLAGLAAIIAGLWSWMRAAGLSQGFLVHNATLELAPIAILAVVHLFPRRPAPVLGMVLAVLLVQRTGEAGSMYPTLPTRAFYPAVAPLDTLPREEPEPYRIVGLDYTLPPNYATMYGLEDVRGNTPLTFRGFKELYPLWCEPELWFNLVRSLDSPMLSLLNVRFALTERQSRPPPGWRLVAAANGVSLLENRHALGRAFVPERVTVDLDPDLVPKRMAEATTLSHRAWIDTGWTGAGRVFRRSSNGPGEVWTRRLGLGYLIDARMEEPGWVVVSENAWRGWRAWADGKPLPLARADHAFLAFHLDAGHHSVRLRYRPTAFVAGAAITWSTLVALALLTVIVWSRRRASGAP